MRLTGLDLQISPISSLPDAQQDAIAHGDGPCLVLAAPGSGKTYVVTRRFIRLVREEGLQPGEILALAYNRRAADEMLERVERELGPISGDPPLTTYHGWALSVIRRFGWRRGLAPTFRIASGAERSMCIAEVLAELKPRALYDPSRPYESVQNINKLIERAKQELVKPAAYLAHVEEQLSAYRAPKDGKRPHLEIVRDTPLLAGDHVHWELQYDLALVYAGLEEKYRRDKLIDHEDAIAMAADLLMNDDEVADAYAGIKYAMVDEFQDTNSAQAAMVETLVGSHGNLMVVADDDQSIYRFRGASRVNIERFRRTYPARREIALEVNRRSTPEIIDFCQAVISASSDREPKTIRSLRPSGEKTRVIWACNYRDEAEAVVREAERHLQEGARPKDIAVLTQMRADMEPIADAFRAAGVPYVLLQGRELFRSEEIKRILALLEAIDDPDSSQAILRCLQLPAWALSGAARAAVLKATKRDDRHVTELLRGALGEGFSDEDRERADLMMTDLLELQEMALTNDVRAVFTEAMARTEFAALGELPDPLDRARFASNVSRLYEVIDDYGRNHPLDANLEATLRYLRLVQESRDEREAQIDGDIDAVQICTIHGAKGLEWPHVVVCGAVQSKIPRGERDPLFNLPATLAPAVEGESDGHLEEQRRLFYVGLSRAKDTLAVTWAKRYPKDFRDQKPSEFLAAVPQTLRLDTEQPAGMLPSPKRHKVKPLLENGRLELSYSSIQDFRDCPRRFEYRRLWHMPTLFSPESWYGDRIHNTLKTLGERRLGGESITARVVEETWLAEWNDADGRGRVRDLRQAGLDVLLAYTSSPLWTDGDLHRVEYPFKLPVGDERGREQWMITGQVDRIDLLNGIPHVIDYKTGRPGTEKTVNGSFQLKIYAHAAMSALDTDEVWTSIHWLQTAEAATVLRTRKEIENFDYGLLKSFEAIEFCALNGYYPPYPNAYRCGRCAYRLICPEKAEDLPEARNLAGASQITVEARKAQG